ncbi:phosphoglycerate dehydrogenase [Haloglomus halophilum]|uniref:phosphoglycerate dehydrogenase n=1 Tax=Haloglomus halophilum TaxID=2962672 RepID=UPI0020C944B4|nr:phosphoglycerate dehydrogenase [Haloglomus halophilum]
MAESTTDTSGDDRDYRVLISCPLILDDIDKYQSQLNENGISYTIADVDQQLDEHELLETLPAYDGILAGDDELSAEVIESCPRLKVISKWGIGTDNIDFDAAERHGVEVYNTPGAFTDEVADIVIGYAILLTRQLHQIDNAVRQGKWFCPRGTSLQGKRFGVVGVGNIGSTVARRAAAHGMKVIGNDVQPLPDDLVEDIGIEPVDRSTLFEEADIVSLNCALVDGTRNLVSHDELAALGSDGYLINTARGELIDQDALISALESGTIAGAGLDVFQREPLPADSPLTELDNVVLGTHNAQNTHEAVASVNERAVRNLVEGLST